MITKYNHFAVTFNDNEEVFYVITTLLNRSISDEDRRSLFPDDSLDFEHHPDRDGGRNVRSFKPRGWSMDDSRASP